MAERPFFDVLEPLLSLGSSPDDRPVRDLSGFAAIVNVSDWNAPRYQERLDADAHLARVPFDDSTLAPLPFVQAACLELARRQQAGARTLVHCQSGQSRSATVVALYWMARDGLTWEQAVQALRAKRACIAPHPLLTNPSGRQSIVAALRAFLAGDDNLYQTSKDAAAALLAADRNRPAEPTVRQGDWNLIDAELAVGCPPEMAHNLAAGGITDLVGLNVPERKWPGLSRPPSRFNIANIDALPADEVQPIIDHISGICGRGGRCLIFCNEGRLLSPALATLYLMQARAWDYGSALWYLKQRRRAVLPHPRLLQS